MLQNLLILRQTLQKMQTLNGMEITFGRHIEASLVKEYTFLGRECKSTGIGKIEAEVFMSQEEIFIPRSDSWLSSRGLADDV